MVFILAIKLAGITGNVDMKKLDWFECA